MALRLSREDSIGEHRNCPLGNFLRTQIACINPNRRLKNLETAQPRSLLFGEATGLDLDVLDGLFEGAVSFQILKNLLVAKRFARILTKRAGVMQAANFVDQAGINHPLYTGVDAPIDHFDRVVEPDDEDRIPILRRQLRIVSRRLPLSLEAAELMAGGLKDFNSPNGALPIVWVDSLGRGWIHAFEPSAQGGQIHALEPGTERFVRLRHVGKAIEQGLNVQVGSADDDRISKTARDVADGMSSQFEPAVNAERIIAGIGDIQEVMGHGLPLLR